jgi:hypothetical protein
MVTMTQDAAAWVREHVWTPAMRKTYREVPAFYSTCDCQFGATQWCQTGRHDRCHRAEPLVSCATMILRRGGLYPASFTEEFTHPTPSATGPVTTSLAQVWLADRRCRWVCPCECHAPEPDPREVLAFVVRAGLYDPDSTAEDLTPPCFRAYRAEMEHQARVKSRRQRQARKAAEVEERAAAADRVFRAKRDRREAIKEWGQQHGWPMKGGRLPQALIEAYEVAVEGGEGQGALF